MKQSVLPSADEVPPSAEVPVSPVSSFEQVFAAYSRFVWRTVRALGVPPQQVEDAVQDVFVVVHRRLDTFRGPGSPKSWVYQIARRIARDYRRRTVRKGGLEALPDDLRDNAPDALDTLARTQNLKLVECILDQLDEKAREVLVLAEFEELRPPEIAELLDTNLNTIYTRLRRAREAFDAALKRRTTKEG